MNTPQEQITQYLMDYWPGTSFEQLRNHAAKICKLFAPTIAGVEDKNAQLKADRDKTHADAAKLLVDNLALEASCSQLREALLKIQNNGRWSADVATGLLGPERDGPWCLVDHNHITKALSADCGKEFLERLNELEKENAELNKALALKLDAMPSGLSAGQSKVLENRLKTAASMLRSAVYERTPLGDKWIDHFDVERQKAITEFLASVEGKP